MPKSIRVDGQTYDQLAGLLRPRESFNDVVVRLLAVNDKTTELLNVIEGSTKFREGQRERLESTGAPV